MSKLGRKIIVFTLIIGLFGPSFSGLGDFVQIKKAEAESIGDALLNDKDKLALEGNINEPGDNGSAALQILQGESLDNLHQLLSRYGLKGAPNIGEEWKTVYSQEFTSSLNEFQQSYWNFINQSQRLALTEQDIEAIRLDRVDRRIKKFLIYLVAPKYLGGAGHEYINVSRIIATDGDVNKSREPSILTHAFPDFGYSQAADIAMVDYARCTLIKKRFIRTSYIPQSPVPIQIKWQGGKIGTAKEELGLSINQLIMGGSSTSFMDMLEEFGLNSDDYSADEFKDGVDIRDAAEFVGRALFEQVISSPSHSWQGADLNQILQNLGKAIIADQIGISRQALQGGDPEEIVTNIGRYSIEQSLNLSVGSLKGKTSDEILKNVAKRKLEKELGIPSGTLKEDKINSQSDFYKVIGQGLIEATMHIKPGSLETDDYGDFNKALGNERAKWLQDNASSMDEKLELPPDTTKDFNSNHNVSGYKINIGQTTIEHKANIYKNYLWQDGISTDDPDQPTNGTQANKKDEAFGTPEGTFDQIIQGDFSVLPKIGAYEIAKAVSTNNQHRELLYHWLYQPYTGSDYLSYVSLSEIDASAAQMLYSNNDFHIPGVSPDNFSNYELNETELTSKFKTLHNGDLDSIFIYNDPQRIFKKEGYQSLFDGLKNSTLGQKAEQKFNEMAKPYIEKITEINNDINFYKTRLDDIDTRTNRIEANLSGVNINQQAILDSIRIIRTKFKYLSDHLAINSIKSTFKDIQKQWLVLNAEINKPEYADVKVKIIRDVNGIHRDIEELLSGKPSPLGDDTDLIKNDGAAVDPKTICDRLGLEISKGSLYSCKDLVGLVQHPDQLDEFSVSIARKKVELQLDMPSYSLGYFLNAPDKTFEAFKSGVGQALLEETLDLPTDSFKVQSGAQNQTQGVYQNLISSLQKQSPMLSKENAEARINSMFYLPPTCGQEKVCLTTLLEGGSQDAWNPYLDNLKKFDNKFSLGSGTTYRFLSGSISLADYTGLIGEVYLTVKVVDRIAGSSGVRVLGQKLTAKDVYQILIGHNLDPFAKIGGKKLESQFHLPEGYGYKLVTAEKGERLTLMAEIGGLKLGSIVGIERPIPFQSGNLLDNIGNTALEDAIGLTPQSFKGSLDEIISANNYLFIVGFGLPNIMEDKLRLNWSQLREDLVYRNYTSETYKEFVRYTQNNPELTQAIKERIAPQVVAGPGNAAIPNPLYMSLQDLEANNFPSDVIEQARRFQYRLAQIDNKLTLPMGETAKFLKGEISADKYREEATGRFFTNLAAVNLDSWLNLDEKYHFTLGGEAGLVAIYNQLQDPATRSRGEANLYDAFSAVFSVDLDKKAGFTRGTLKSIILNPSESHAILFTQGLMKLEDSLGVGPRDQDSKWNKFGLNGFLQKAYNAYQVAYDENGDKGEATTAATKSLITTFENSGAMYAQQKIKDSTENSIIVPLNDVIKIAHGDLTLLAIIKLADYAANINFIKDNNGNRVPAPEKYRLNYQDIVYALRGDPAQENQIRTHSQAAASLEYEKLNPRPINYNQSLDSLIPNTSEPFAVNYLGYSQTPTSDGLSVMPPPPDLDTDEELENEIGWDRQQAFSNMSLPNQLLSIDNQTCRVTGDASEEQLAYQSNKCDYIKDKGENAIARQRRYWRTNPIYKVMDTQMYQANRHIPPGFARAMIEGGTMDRVYSVGGLLENVIRDNNDSGIIQYLPPNTINNVVRFFSLPHDQRNGQMDLVSPALGGIDNYLREKVFDGDFPPSGSNFTLTLITTATNGWKFSAKPTINGQEMPSLNDVLGEAAWGAVSKYADRVFKWDVGTAYMVYRKYKAFESARKTYLAASHTLKNVNDAQRAQATADASKAAQSYNAVKAEIITLIITTVFSKQLAKLDQQWGLPAGTLAGAIGVIVLSFVPVDPTTFIIAVVFLAINIFFGVRKIEYKCSACGYYPKKVDYNPMPERDLSCRLGEFDGMNESSYRDGLVSAAKYKANEVMEDTLKASERTKDDQMRPTQVIMYNYDDVLDEAYLITQLYGTISQRGNSGVWSNDQVVEHVHIGY